MKKNIDNENIVLDEEMQNVKKQKSTAKRNGAKSKKGRLLK